MLTLFVGAATLLTFFFTRAASLEEIDILGGSLRRDLLGRTADQLRTLLDVQARCSRQLSDGVWRAWDFNETLAGPAPPDVRARYGWFPFLGCISVPPVLVHRAWGPLLTSARQRHLARVGLQRDARWGRHLRM